MENPYLVDNNDVDEINHKILKNKYLEIEEKDSNISN